MLMELCALSAQQEKKEIINFVRDDNKLCLRAL
jgi:hypothetical protein